MPIGMKSPMLELLRRQEDFDAFWNNDMDVYFSEWDKFRGRVVYEVLKTH
jgi:hypothetical protein